MDASRGSRDPVQPCCHNISEKLFWTWQIEIWRHHPWKTHQSHPIPTSLVGQNEQIQLWTSRFSLRRAKCLNPKLGVSPLFLCRRGGVRCSNSRSHLSIYYQYDIHRKISQRKNRNPTFPKTHQYHKQDQTISNKRALNLNPAQGALARLQRSLALAGERGDLHFGVHHSHRGGLDVFETRLLEDAGHVGPRTLEKPRLMVCGYDGGQFRIYSLRRW